ncbi:hypothetical protein ASA1KI_24070 [Opitutales bacterium ASA1]|nr:hypothetical protein ASA1KI_24070 [Opitutales bacterium ASA1]
MVFAAATLPWWGAALGVAIAGRFGVDVDDWRVTGYTRFEFEGVRWADGAVAVEAGRVSLALDAWGEAPERATAVVVADLKVEISSAVRREDESEPDGSAWAIFEQVLLGWRSIERHAPGVRVDRASLAVSNRTVVVDEATWTGGVLRARGIVPFAGGVTLELAQAGPESLRAGIVLAGSGATVDLEAEREEDMLRLVAEGTWRGNRLEARAQFGRDGWLPVVGEVEAPQWNVPADVWGIAGYGPIGGGGSLRWDGRRYAASAAAQAEPESEQAGLPPIDVDVRASGDLERLSVEAVDVRFPGLRASLAEPLGWDFAKGRPERAGRFSVAVVGDALPWGGLSGTLEGVLDATLREDEEWEIVYEARGRDLAWRNLRAEVVELEGRWAAPRLEVERLRIQSAETSHLEGAGAWNSKTDEIEAARLTWDLDGEVVRSFGVSAPQFGRVSGEAEASGPRSEPQHQGVVRATALEAYPGAEYDVEGRWSGAGAARAWFEIGAESENSERLALEADVEAHPNGGYAFAVSRGEWSDGHDFALRLIEPANVVVGEGERKGAIAWRGVHVGGSGVDASSDGELAWPAEGRVRFEASDLDLGRFGDVVEDRLRTLAVSRLRLDAEWNQGPVTMVGEFAASYELGDGVAYALEADVRTNGQARSLEASLRVLSGSGSVLSGTGAVPLVLEGSSEGFVWAIPDDGPVRLELRSSENSRFWDSVAEAFGWGLSEPVLRADVSGTWRRPTGEVEFSARTLRWPTTRAEELARLPAVENVYLRTRADGDGVELVEGLASIEGRWIRVAGSAPWAVVREVEDGAGFAWEKTTFEFASNPLPVEMAARIFPTVLAPTGELSFDVRHAPGSGLEGRVWLHGAALRPIAPIGAIREIDAELLFESGRVKLPRLAAVVGGRPLGVEGGGRVGRGDDWELDLRLKSDEVPLVRDSGLIVRAGLDVGVTRRRGETARIHGLVTLGQSVFFSDLSSIVPSGGIASPSQRPPFFSVEEKPFSDWKLDLEIRGVEFLRLDTPFFEGVLSTDARLVGTLGEPQAIGTVTSESGSILFPFASLRLEDLELALTRESPYDPILRANGATRIFGYDVRLTASGTASEPRLQFASDPALSSQEIFLMLTAGAIPERENGFTSTERAQRLAMFVGRNLAANLGLSGSGAGGDRLTVRSGENFSREGRETIYVQYDLNGRWSVVGEYDRFDAYNGGIKFRLVDR